MRLVSTRNPSHRATFLDALQRGFAPDGGLYVPEPVACFRDVSCLLEMGFQERSLVIVHRLLGEEFSLEELELGVMGAFDFPLPLTRIGDRMAVLEPFHGPTASIEDFGARFLARMQDLAEARGTAHLKTLLTATAGASGAAVAHAFAGRRGTRVVILYPKGRISALEARQIATPGGNVLAYAVEGDLDACQALVCLCRADHALAEPLHLGSADATHIAWLLAFVLLHFEAVAQLRALGFQEAPVMAVPGGDLGLLYAGLWAKAMGLPVKAFVVAANANRTVSDYLNSSEYLPRPSVPTLTKNLDIAEPFNWERVTHFFGGDLGRMREALRWGSVDDAATRKAMWELHQRGFVPEAHGAVAYGVLEERRALNETGVFMAPMHPAKDHELLERAMNLKPEWPASLAALAPNPPTAKVLPKDLAALRKELGAS